jgi:hypothetical protein
MKLNKIFPSSLLSTVFISAIIVVYPFDSRSAIAKPTINKVTQLPKVGILVDKVNAPGCYYSALRTHNQSKSIFRDDNDNVYMNLDRRDVKLQIINDKYRNNFRAGDVQIRLVVTTIARKNGDGSYSNGTITLSRNGKSKVIKVVGDCSC